MQFHFTAIRAFKRRGEVAGIGQTAAFAKRRFNETNLRAATRTDKAVLGRGVFRATKLAGFGIEKCEADIEAVLK